MGGSDRGSRTGQICECVAERWFARRSRSPTDPYSYRSGGDGFGFCGRPGLLQPHTATAVVAMGLVFVGDGLCPANGAAGASDKNAKVSTYRPTPPALCTGSLGRAGLLQVHTATAAVGMGSVFVGDGLCPANGAAGAPDKSAKVSTYRPTPPPLRAGSLGEAGLLQIHTATAAVGMGLVFVGDGLCPANGAAGAPGKVANVSVYRPPRHRFALVRSAEPVSYRKPAPVSSLGDETAPVPFCYNQAAFQKE